jgi:23S rRNA (guanosine2251-2'-O)-methyltransferase
MARKLKNIELNRLTIDEFKNSPKWPVVVILDNVRSMLNVGSIFRTCDAFNIKHLYLTGITPRPPHREISKTAIGAELAVSWSYHQDTKEIINELREQGFKIYGVEQTSDSVLLSAWTPKGNDKVAVVLGHEIDGVSDQTLDLCDASIEVPQFGTKHSLNVSVCAGVILWQAVQPHLTNQ